MNLRSAMLLGAALALSLACFGCGGKKHVRVVSSAPPVPLAPGAEQIGIASWYGHPYHGRPEADGEIYDMEKLTAAHRTLPFGTWVHVTNLSNGRTVDVRIIDRGPFIDGRIIDLSHAAAEAIGSVGPGLAQVRLEIMSLPPANSNWFAVQVGAFADKERAERLRESLEQEFGTARMILRPGTPPLWRVLVGKETSEQGAQVLAQRVRVETGTAFVVRLDMSAAPSVASDSVSTQP